MLRKSDAAKLRVTHGKFQMLFRDKTRLCLQHRSHDFLTKLADIARPRMGQQCLAGFSVKADDIAWKI